VRVWVALSALIVTRTRETMMEPNSSPSVVGLIGPSKSPKNSWLRSSSIPWNSTDGMDAVPLLPRVKNCGGLVLISARQSSNNSAGMPTNCRANTWALPA